MAALKNYQNCGAQFANAEEVIRVVYDFSQDGGATGDYDVLVSKGDSMVKLEYAIVKTAVTSGGSMTMDLGKGNTGVEFMSGQAVAGLTAGAIFKPTYATSMLKLADGEKINMGLNVAAATAGKVEFVFKVMKY